MALNERLCRKRGHWGISSEDCSTLLVLPGRKETSLGLRNWWPKLNCMPPGEENSAKLSHQEGLEEHTFLGTGVRLPEQLFRELFTVGPKGHTEDERIPKRASLLGTEDKGELE